MWMTSGSARNSVTGNMFQDLIRGKRKKPTVAKSKRSLQQMTEKDLFLELIRDIANELDVNIVCHKILVNVSILTKSDRGSLFLARGRGDQRCLVSKLFDVSEHSTVDDSVCDEDSEITIPFGKGIAGTVALTKETINIKNAYEDPRFNQEVDLKTGYRTRSILCLPILNYEGETIGVAQIMNKTDGEQEFSEQDERVFRDYLTFCGIGLTNAQLFEMSVMEYKRNQMLLNLAKGIFEEQSNLDNLVQKIMLEAQDLLKCERCYVYLIYNSLEMDKFVSEKHADALKKLREAKAPPKQAFTHPQNVRFSKVFRLNAKNSGIVDYPSPSDLENSPNAEIAKEIVTTGQVLNVTEATTDPKFGKLIEDCDGFKAKTLVCVPIKNSEGKVIGVVQLMNKANGKHFNDNDIHVLEAFAIFCGLGIHNCQMYESACKLMAKQTVALEVLSYHATAAQEETDKLKAAVIPESEEYKLYTFDFSDFPLSDDDTCKATIRMFLDSGVVNKFHVPYEVLCRWTLSVKKNYRPVIYHNWRHAFNVAQTMFTMFYTGNMGRLLTELEVFSLLVACLCHDLDHRGTNNAFQSKVESPLALLYSTSTMEHHHFDHCIMILNSEGNNIFQHLSPEDYKEALRILESGILSTDLALYFKKRGGFVELVEKGEKEWKDPQKRDLLRGMMMTACDVAAICKPWEVQREVAQLVASEFFEQGDLERSKLHLEPIAMMDRQKKDELPKMQVGFIDAICMPVYKLLSELFPGLTPMYRGCCVNREEWHKLAIQEEGGNSQEDAPSEEKKNSSSTNGHMSSSLEPSDDKTKVDNSRTEIQLQSPQKKHKIDGKQPTKYKTDGKEPKSRRQQESRTCALL